MRTITFLSRRGILGCALTLAAYHHSALTNFLNILQDLHHYEEPSFFLEQFNFFDNWQEETNNQNVTIFVGEYSVFSVDTPSGKINFSDPIGEHVFYPQLLSAIAESVYLLAMERNPNVVRMSSYAPSFQNFNWVSLPSALAYTLSLHHSVQLDSESTRIYRQS